MRRKKERVDIQRIVSVWEIKNMRCTTISMTLQRSRYVFSTVENMSLSAKNCAVTRKNTAEEGSEGERLDFPLLQLVSQVLVNLMNEGIKYSKSFKQ